MHLVNKRLRRLQYEANLPRHLLAHGSSGLRIFAGSMFGQHNDQECIRFGSARKKRGRNFGFMLCA